MADLEEKLNAILGNPEAMGQIMSIARSLSDAGDAADSDAHSGGEATQAVPSSSEDSDGDTGGQAPNSEAVAALLSGRRAQ